MTEKAVEPSGWESALMAAETVKERPRRTTRALDAARFVYHHVLGVHTFADGPTGKPSGAVQIHFAGEKVRPEDEHAMPDIDESERAVEFQVAKLDALSRMKLTAYRRKDQVRLLDLIGVGLLDASWLARLPAPLGVRLQQLLDDPNG